MTRIWILLLWAGGRIHRGSWQPAKAKECQIYTDVEGVFTADPRLVPEAHDLKNWL